MVQYQHAVLTKRKGTGGRRRLSHDKRLANYGGFFARPHYDKDAEKEERRTKRMRGGQRKVGVHTGKFVNVVLKDGKIQKVEITNVAESPDNRHFARENLITKGAILETALGKAKVTSRPSQHGVINAKLI